MNNTLFFYRRRGGTKVLQAMQWRSFCDASAVDRNELLELLGDGDYIQATVFVPASMMKGGEEDD